MDGKKQEPRPGVKLARKRTSLAEERTERAEGRTTLANERTFSAWVRTDIAAQVAGLGIARFLGTTALPWLAISIGALLIVAGAGAYAFGIWSYRRRGKEFEENDLRVPGLGALQLMVGLLFLSAVLSFVLLLVH